MAWFIENEWGAEAGNMLLAGQSQTRVYIPDADLMKFVGARALSIVQDKLLDRASITSTSGTAYFYPTSRRAT